MYKCKYCEKEFNNLNGVARHNVRTHKLTKEQVKIEYAEYYPHKEITEDMIKCDVCGEYMLPLGLPSHLSKKHKLSGIEYYNQYKKKDKNEGKCIVCGKPTTFITIEEGFRKYCSAKCSHSTEDYKEKLSKSQKENWDNNKEERLKKVIETNQKLHGFDFSFNDEENRKKCIDVITRDDIKEKRKATCQERYGSDNPFKNQQVQEKAIKTVQEKYGVDNVFQNEDIKKKIKQTNIKKYGVENPSQNEEIKEKIKNTVISNNGGMGASSKSIQEKMKQTCLDKYGVENAYQSPKIKEKIEQKRLENIKQFCIDNNCIAINDLDIEYPHPCVNFSGVETISYSKGTKFIYIEDIDKVKRVEQEIIDNINSQGSYGELDLYNFISSIYEGEIIKRTRKIISPLELDLYIPDKKVAIEFNGSYWHSTNAGTPSNYHLNKTELCEEQNIHLIHIFEYEWQNKSEICKSIIANALGIYNNKIYARNCKFREVDIKEKDAFLEENHIQGKIKSTKNYGLYYKDELVQILCLGTSRFKKDEIELLRMCTKLNTQVVGGFSKLLKDSDITNLISYIDRAKFTGSGYEKIGFKQIGITKPSYVYCLGNIYINRMVAQKHKLPKLLGIEYFDENKTEVENMINNNWLQIYDCGCIKMQYKRNS